MVSVLIILWFPAFKAEQVHLILVTSMSHHFSRFVSFEISTILGGLEARSKSVEPCLYIGFIF